MMLSKNLTLNQRKSFQRRKDCIFRKAYELQTKLNAKVAVIIEIQGETHLYNHADNTNWPPSIDDLLLSNPKRKSPTDFQTARDAAFNRELRNYDYVNDTSSLLTDSNRGDTPFEPVHVQSLESFSATSRMNFSSCEAYEDPFQLLEVPLLQNHPLEFTEYTVAEEDDQQHLANGVSEGSEALIGKRQRATSVTDLKEIETRSMSRRKVENNVVNLPELPLN